MSTAPQDVRIPDARIAERLERVERQLAELVAAHRSHAGHLRHLDKATDAIATAAAAAVEAARDAARAERIRAAGERVRVRAVRPVDLAIGGRSTLRLDPSNVRANVCRIFDRAAWLAIAELDEVRAAIDSGAIRVEDLAPGEGPL